MTNSQLMFLIAAILAVPLFDVKIFPAGTKDDSASTVMVNIGVVLVFVVLGIVFHVQNS